MNSRFQFIMTSIMMSILYIIPQNLFGQLDMVSGIINQYTVVTSVDLVNDLVIVTNPGLFVTNDRVILMQMKGAIIDESNTATFGGITQLNDAGNYEFATVCNVDIGTGEVTFQNEIVNTYNSLSVSNPAIQLIRVPQYVNDVTIIDTLKAQHWNGATGGVLAFEAGGIVTLNEDIDVSGAGFEGGSFTNDGTGCSFLDNKNDYHYASTEDGGRKGEGITDYIVSKENGRGPLASGGGGGNDHNSGGGGGGNYLTGGPGGTNVTTAFGCSGNHTGLGGLSLLTFGYTNVLNRVFLGGGGAAGHGNNSQGTKGADGGGIVMIKATEINGNSQTIRAQGTTAQDANGDGAGGGGAGGVVMLSVDFYTNNLTIDVAGGDGGHTGIASSVCSGPGGGGAGGFIWVSSPMGAPVTRVFSGGSPGTADGCGSPTNGAGAGLTGSELTSLVYTEGLITSSCVLSVNDFKLEARLQSSGVQLEWNAAGIETRAFEIEMSADLESFTKIHRINSNTADDYYSWIDIQPLYGKNHYRIKAFTRDGGIRYSTIQEVRIIGSELYAVKVFPQPLSEEQTLTISWYQPRKETVQLTVHDLQGKKLSTYEKGYIEGNHQWEWKPTSLARGIYILTFATPTATFHRRLVIQ